jgi:hypothetical protein
MTAVNSAGALVVTGEPGVGKSALTLRAVEQLAADGAVVTALNMRDLPTTPSELEALLGAPLPDVLVGGPTDGIRLLVLDGAEVALEGRAPLLQEFALAALRAGLGVVAVTCTDGARRVSELLGRAAGTTAPREHVLLPLTDGEADRLTATLPALHRLGNDDRCRWLLGRPGLVDLILQSGVTPGPGDILSRADVFAAVWDGLVLTSAGSPDPVIAGCAVPAVAAADALARATATQRGRGHVMAERRTLAAAVRPHVVDPVVRGLLRSPAHRLLSGSVLLVACTGRRSGVRRELPVMYAETGGHYVVVAGRPDTKTWWRNFADDVRPVTLTVAGRLGSARARLLEPSSAAYRLALDAYRVRYPPVPVEETTPVLVLSPDHRS